MSGIFENHLVAGLLFACLIGGSPIWAAEPTSIALATFDYIDSSGEMQDQTKKHAALIADFMRELRDDVGQNSKFRIVPLLCEGLTCTARSSEPSDLIAAAQSRCETPALRRSSQAKHTHPMGQGGGGRP